MSTLFESMSKMIYLELHSCKRESGCVGMMKGEMGGGEGEEAGSK